MTKPRFDTNRVICTNDCLSSNPNIANKFDLVRFVYRRAKQLESDKKTPLMHFLSKIRTARVLTEDGEVCTGKSAFQLVGRASVLNTFEATNSIEAAIKEVFYKLRSPEIDDVIEYVKQLHNKQASHSEQENLEEEDILQNESEPLIDEGLLNQEYLQINQVTDEDNEEEDEEPLQDDMM